MSERYRVTGDVVLDTQTRLEWQAKHAGPMTWHAAMRYAEHLDGGWRLPTIEELETLIDRTRVDPASAFPGAKGEWFWTLSSYADTSSIVWIVYFDDGTVGSDDKTGCYYVRCVRGGPVAVESPPPRPFDRSAPRFCNCKNCLAWRRTTKSGKGTCERTPHMENKEALDGCFDGLPKEEGT